MTTSPRGQLTNAASTSCDSTSAPAAERSLCPTGASAAVRGAGTKASCRAFVSKKSSSAERQRKASVLPTDEGRHGAAVEPS